MTAFTHAVSATQAGHPITRVATLPSSSKNTVLLVCAGGSSVSVQLAPRWLVNPANGGNVSNGITTAATGVLQHALHGPSEPSTAAAGVEVGKGADALLAVARQWSVNRQGDGSASLDDNGRELPSSTSCFSSALTAEQRSSLQSGEVASLCVAALPGTDTALAVVGSTVGTVALFLIEGSRTLGKVAECALGQWSRGGITSQDAVVDVAFSMDPAGRPEFVAAASVGCVVVVDVQLLYRRDDGESSNSNHNHDDETETEGGRRWTSPCPSEDVWSTSVLRAKAIEALERPKAQLVRRSRSEVFVCPFAEANVVRVLAPQRLHAAVAMDVALVVVLSDGTLHYVERVIDGGSVRLLAEHHRMRFAKGSSFIFYAQDSMLAAPASEQGEKTNADGFYSADSRVLPHVIYRYRLSSHTINVCQLGNAGDTLSSGIAGSTAAATSSSSFSSADSVTVVNDAALYFSEKDAVCHVVVAGTQLLPTKKTTAGCPSSLCASGAGVNTASAVDVASAVAAGWTLGRLNHEKGVWSSSVMGGNGGGHHRTLGWWAVAHNAVLPRFTFDRVSLERQAFQQHLRQQNEQQSQSQSSFNQTEDSTAHNFALAYTTDAGSPFLVRVQSNVMALPSTSLGAAAALSTTPVRQMAATAIGGGGGVEGSGFYATLPTSPVGSSPTGTGAQVAAGNAISGMGNGFAAVAMTAGVLVLSAGTDLYVGDLGEVPVNAKSLPTLRPVRSFGAVVENISFGPSTDTLSVLVATGSRVVPVPL